MPSINQQEGVIQSPVRMQEFNECARWAFTKWESFITNNIIRENESGQNIILKASGVVHANRNRICSFEVTVKKYDNFAQIPIALSVYNEGQCLTTAGGKWYIIETMLGPFVLENSEPIEILHNVRYHTTIPAPVYMIMIGAMTAIL